MTIVFLDLDFLQDAEILMIRLHLRQMQDYYYLRGFSGPLGPK